MKNFNKRLKDTMYKSPFDLSDIRAYFRSSDATIYDMNDAILMIRDEIADNSPITDILDNQNYNSLKLAHVMQTVDPSLEVKLEKRNGLDYHFVTQGRIEEGEMKACKIKGKTLKSSGGWQFHAYAILENGDEDNFIFYAQKNGIPQRIYDVRCPAKVSVINAKITGMASEWKAKVDRGEKNGKFDGITISEGFVRDLFVGEPVYEYDGELTPTVRTNIMVDQKVGVASIQSDYLGRSPLV